MIKMQIVMDDQKIAQEGKYNLNKLHSSLDDFLVSKLGFTKGDNGFYFGGGTRNDYSHFGVAMTTLGKKSWFMDNVNTWLYYNSDDSSDPDDFAIEDFKEFCFNRYQVSA
jgi:hypothetical protein